MKVREVMTRDVQTSTPGASLTEVAKLMRDGDCGIVPLVDVDGRVAGVLTDRDITMTLVSTARGPNRIAASEIMVRAVHTCGPDDDVRAAMRVMQHYKVRRLPVVDDRGTLKGLLSIDDVILRALALDAPTSAEIVTSLREILQGLRSQPVSMV